MPILSSDLVKRRFTAPFESNLKMKPAHIGETLLKGNTEGSPSDPVTTLIFIRMVIFQLWKFMITIIRRLLYEDEGIVCAFGNKGIPRKKRTCMLKDIR